MNTHCIIKFQGWIHWFLISKLYETESLELISVSIPDHPYLANVHFFEDVINVSLNTSQGKVPDVDCEVGLIISGVIASGSTSSICFKQTWSRLWTRKNRIASNVLTRITSWSLSVSSIITSCQSNHARSTCYTQALLQHRKHKQQFLPPFCPPPDPNPPPLPPPELFLKVKRDTVKSQVKHVHEETVYESRLGLHVVICTALYTDLYPPSKEFP